MKKLIKTKKYQNLKKDYTAIVLEDMRSDFRAFGEMLGAVKEKGDLTHKKVGYLENETKLIKDTLLEVKEKGDATFEEVGKIKEEISGIKGELSGVNFRLDKIEQELISIKSEIKDLKQTLTRKADIERVHSLELRMGRIERHLKLISASR